VQRTKAATPTYQIKEAVADDYWGISTVHCQSFYPMSHAVLEFFLRLDRVMSLQLGKKIEEGRKVKSI
jgi:hypothetical protein